MKSQKGVTIIELMISLVVMALILIITIPSFTDYIRNNQLRSLADEFQASIQQAKNEAIKRNARVNLLLADTGWTIDIPARAGEAETRLLERAAESSQARLAISASSNTIGFNSQGRLADGGVYTADINSQNSADCMAQGGKVRCLRVQVSTAGQIKICDPNLASTDPRSC
ncbi:MAG: ral secretion pathway protein [Gammaproteobacteria bacterium]|jgi:type IV fimbrial biogenesis protein FimT|nr:ral secretion pathway protein [Gammaproteobacteria bacterium]